MSATETAVTALERNWDMVDRSLDGLDDELLGARLNDESNSIGWLLWHKTRFVDCFVHAWCQDVPQIWIKDGWNKKFGLGDDDNETGQGWTKEQVAAWTLPPKELLVGYYEAVKSAALGYIGSLSESDMERELNVSSRPTASISWWLGIVVFDNCVHGGQIAHLRGYYKGMGWFV